MNKRMPTSNEDIKQMNKLPAGQAYNFIAWLLVVAAIASFFYAIGEGVLAWLKIY